METIWRSKTKNLIKLKTQIGVRFLIYQYFKE